MKRCASFASSAKDTKRETTVCGTLLPPGMTPACAQELASLFKQRADPECWITNIDLAVMAFEVLEAYRHEGGRSERRLANCAAAHQRKARA